MPKVVRAADVSGKYTVSDICDVLTRCESNVFSNISSGTDSLTDNGSLRYYLRGQAADISEEEYRKMSFTRLLYNASPPPGHADLVSAAVIMDDGDSKVRVLCIDHEMAFAQQQDEILVTPTCGFTDLHIGKNLEPYGAFGFFGLILIR